MAKQSISSNNGPVSRIRGVSISLINANPQLGVWQAAGTAIAQAPTLGELRDSESGGTNIAFNAQGHSARFAVQEPDGELALATSNAKRPIFSTSIFNEVLVDTIESPTEAITRGAPVRPLEEDRRHGHHRRRSLYERHKGDAKERWKMTLSHGLNAFWKFFKTPSGFLISIYFVNIVAWGAMLFFLLLKAAPAMNHPSADDDDSPRKKWLEIDSQILNALFCVTGFGLAPWRFRDLYLFVGAVRFKNRTAMRRLAEQNKSWFRPPPTWLDENEREAVTVMKSDAIVHTTTFTGEKAPPTPLWKLGFAIWMMVLNTLLQAILCYYMWGYNRIDRPIWATGTFIACGCCVAMFAGLMSWWEGRKVKKIEGPLVEIVDGAV
ncbi:hypothetical protein BGZ61DRAFT_374784 [Ilyonectria robusta]|uniref:uncharacterized protein n=1 Tax=Ilyonectria robusta TaxID=1079257 RepID=UPI001E8CA090|nr:uncharacterized protein BGZ61DRAFT_374784 [Ilyonectria robusta]KAH8652586.1 hypothetical protein BGZ61DRAFT_374784 [Ilyonectria robusta]